MAPLLCSWFLLAAAAPWFSGVLADTPETGPLLDALADPVDQRLSAVSRSLPQPSGKPSGGLGEGEVDGDGSYMQLLQMNAKHVQVKAKANKCSSSWGSHGRYMDCGPGVPLCGVLVVETGKGDGVYKSDHPQVHGLWPQVEHYGNSQCIAPDDPADANSLSSCYHQEGDTEQHLLWFQDHEWDKHGKCAGVQDVQDYLGQVCSLSSRPLQIVAGARAAGMDLADTADQLHRLGYCVWNTMSHSQIMLSACADRDGRWKLADFEDFSTVCSSADVPVPAPAPPPAPAPAGQCVPNKRGPACGSNEDCAHLSGCVRCANSGFCTDVPLPVGRCEPNKKGPACSSDQDCLNLSDCVRCAHSGFCTTVPLHSGGSR